MVHPLKKEQKFSLWATMLLIRKTEEEIAARYGEQKMRCPTHLSIGQEAVPAAISIISSKNDYAVSTHRGHAHYLGKGGNIKAMIAELFGKQTGCSKGRGGSMHLIDIEAGFMGTSAIVGNSIPVGVGYGLAAKLEKKKQVSYVFLGDGATEEGAFYEAANFAALAQLPVIFLCENNLYSVYSPLHVRQPKDRKIWKMVGAMGLKSLHIDGNDVEACHHAIQDATERCRQGNGPFFIEFSTYRWREHCGPNYDNDIGYRSEKEFLDWQAKDPLALYREQLNYEFTDFSDFESRTNKEVKNTIDEAFKFAEESPFPTPATAYLDEYAEGEKSW